MNLKFEKKDWICNLIRKLKVATSLVGLEGGVEGAVILADGAAQRAAGGRVGGHLQQVGPGRVVRVYLSRRWQLLSFENLTHLHLRTKPRRVVRVYLSMR